MTSAVLLERSAANNFSRFMYLLIKLPEVWTPRPSSKVSPPVCKMRHGLPVA